MDILSARRRRIASTLWLYRPVAVDAKNKSDVSDNGRDLRNRRHEDV